MKIVNFKNLDEDFYKKIEFGSLQSVEEIIQDVRENGDLALKKYTERFDGLKLETFELAQNEIEYAFSVVKFETIEAIKQAIENVKSFAQKQLQCLSELEVELQGSLLGHKIIPLEKVGCYIPGGNYPLPSSAIMTIVPAKVAGVKKVFAFSPKIKPQTIVACFLSGADKIYRLGGAQAITAMAYGTESIEAVNKIVGPGNKFVTYAKKLVYGECGIDFLAGPSEVLIVADDNADARIVAADMLAQCEHDKDARSYLICFSEKFAKEVQNQAEKLLEQIDTREIASLSFEKSYAVVVDSIERAWEISNKRAPEHLELMIRDCEKYVDYFSNYGSLFLGKYSAEALGDYCTGTNHVLPTNQVAKYCGGLNVFDFVKIQTYQMISQDYAQSLALFASRLSGEEGLLAHKAAAELRLK